MNTPWTAEFERLLREELSRLPADAPLLEDSALADLGLDSLGIVAMLSKVEDVYGVDLDERLDDLRLFSTPGHLWKAVGELRGALPQQA